VALPWQLSPKQDQQLSGICHAATLATLNFGLLYAREAVTAEPCARIEKTAWQIKKRGN
jgi:hypothetical protein